MNFQRVNKLSCSELLMIRFCSFSLLITFTCKLAKKKLICFVRPIKATFVSHLRQFFAATDFVMFAARVYLAEAAAYNVLSLLDVGVGQFCFGLAQIVSVVPWKLINVEYTKAVRGT